MVFLAPLAMAPARPAAGGPTKLPLARTIPLKSVLERRADATPVRDLAARKPDTHGLVFVLEYHHIRAGHGPMFRTPVQFAYDLERLWRLGFRPVTVAEYAANRMPLPRGASPVILTFDDAHPDQFRLRSDGTVDPRCGLGVLMAFAKKHPDFPPRATFYCLPVFFGQRKYRDKKVKLLRELGCEIGTHTMTHPMLSRLSDEGVKREIAGITDFLDDLGLKGPYSFAPPYGLMPRNRSLVKGFVYRGRKYRNLTNAYAFYGAAVSPEDKKFTPFTINRIVAERGYEGIEDYISRAARGKIRLYVSPGPRLPSIAPFDSLRSVPPPTMHSRGKPSRP